MAGKNGSTSTTKAKRSAVMKAAGEHAYQLLLRHREEAAAQQANEQKADKRHKRDSAVEALRHGIMHLADVRSLLRRMEYGEDNYFTPEAQATFARATLSDAATEMEQALFDLGLLNREPCGFFVPDLAEQSEAQAAA